MIDFRKIRLDITLLIAMLIFMAGYHFLIYFNAPWENLDTTIHQIRNDGMIVVGCITMAFVSMLGLIVLTIRKCPIKLAIPLYIMVIFGVLWTGYTLLYDKVSITLLLRDSFPPISMLTCGLVLIGYNKNWWELLKKAMLIIACIFVFYSFYEILIAYSKFGFDYRITYGAPMYLYIIGLYATYGLIVMTDEWKQNKKILVLSLVVLLLFNSIILQGRSWLVQTLILFVIYIAKIKTYFKKNDLLKILIPISIIGLTIAIFISNSEIFTGIADRFQNSGDTRTEQLKAFFEQVSFRELVFGGGINASYVFKDDPNFHFIDNQVLLYMFRYGIVPAIAYLYLLLYPIVKAFKLKDKKLMSKSLVLISWFAAMLGLSVYFNLTFGMAHILIMIYTGRLFYEIKQYKIETTR